MCLPQLEGLRLQVAGRLARRRVRRLCTCIDIQVGLLLRVHAGCDGVVRVAGVFVCVYLRVACGCQVVSSVPQQGPGCRRWRRWHCTGWATVRVWLQGTFGCWRRCPVSTWVSGDQGTWSTAWAQMAGGLTLPYARRRCPCAVRAAVLPCHRQLAHLSVLLHSRLYTVRQRAAGGVRQRLQAGTGPSKRVKKKKCRLCAGPLSAPSMRHALAVRRAWLSGVSQTKCKLDSVAELEGGTSPSAPTTWPAP